MRMSLVPGLHGAFRRLLDRDDSYRGAFPRALVAAEYRQRCAFYLDLEFARAADGPLADRFVEMTVTATLRIPTAPQASRRGRSSTRNATRAVADLTPLTIIGEAGAGKTTCLLNAARSELDRKGMLPVYVPLRGFAAEQHGTLERASLHPALFSQIRHSLARCGVEYDDADRDLFLSELDRHSFLFLFDGLDEVDFQSRFLATQALRAWAECLQSRSSGHHLVVSTRKINFSPADLGFQALELREMEREQIVAFLRRYVKTARGVASIVNHLDEHPQVGMYAQNPRWLFYITQVFNQHGRLPRSLGRLLDQVIDTFLVTGAGSLPAPAAVTKRLLVPVGRALEERGGAVIPYREACDFVRAALLDMGFERSADRPQAALEEFERRGILITEMPLSSTAAGKTVRFRDKTVQDFFAALHLADRLASDGLTAVDVHLEDARWADAVALLPGILDTKDTQSLAERLSSRNVVLMGRLLGNSEDREGAFTNRVVADLSRPLQRALSSMRWTGVLPPVAIFGCWATMLLLLLFLASRFSVATVVVGLPALTGWQIALTGFPVILLLVVPFVVTRLYWRFASEWLRKVRESELLPALLALRSIGSRAARQALTDLEGGATKQLYRVGVFDDDEDDDDDPVARLWEQLLEDIEVAREVVATSPEQLVAAIREGIGTALQLQRLLEVDHTIEPIRLVVGLVRQAAPASVELLRTVDRIVVQGPEDPRRAFTVRAFHDLLHEADVHVDSKRVLHRSLREIREIAGWWVFDRVFAKQIALPSFVLLFDSWRRGWRRRVRRIRRRLTRVRRRL